MFRYTKRIIHFIRDKRGATSIEYGLIAAIMAIALIAGFTVFSEHFTNLFEALPEYIDGALS